MYGNALATVSKKRDPQRFKQAQEELAELRAQAAAGEIELAYVDEVGFAQVHPNRSAWTPKGEQHQIAAIRGKRLNVMAALLSSGKVISAKIWQTFDAGLFVGFMGYLREQLGKPLTVVLDNASIHKSKAFEPHLALLKSKGVKLYFLPTYSPELNRIEKLWHLMKHSWMAAKQRDACRLEADVQHIFDNFGTLDKLQF